MGQGAAKVFFISPDRKLSQIFESDLAGHEIRVELANDPKEALRTVKDMGPSAAIVDERFGEKTSLSTLGALKKAVNPDTALVLLAGAVTKEKVVSAMKAGAHQVIARTIALPVFLGALDKALERAKNEARSKIVKNVTMPTTPPDPDKVWKLLEKVEKLRSVPAVVQQVLSMTASDDKGAAELAKAVLKDQNISALILKTANSALYGAPRKITSIVEAIARLGFRNVRSMVMGLSVIENFSRDQRTMAFDPIEFWRFSMAQAVLAKNLAREVGYVDFEAIYLCGLISNIGMIIFDENLPKEFHLAVTLANDRKVSLSQMEQAVLGVDHARVGKALLEKWNFPPSLTEIVGLASAEAIDAAPAQNRQVARIIHTSQMLCRALDYGNAVDRGLDMFSDRHFREMGLARPLSEAFFKNSAAEIAENWAFLGSGGEEPYVPGTSPAPSPDAIPYHEERSSLISPIRLALERLGVSLAPISSSAEIRALSKSRPAIFLFSTVEGAKAATQANPEFADRRYLILYPAALLPADKKALKDLGLPVGRCLYMPLPADAGELARTVLTLA